MSTARLSAAVRAFEELGFVQQENVPRYHPRNRFYRYSGSTEQAEIFAALDFRPALHAYGLRVGAANPAAMGLLKNELPAIMTYLHTDMSLLRLRELPCWMMFDAGRALGWDLLSIPAPAHESSWPAQLEQFRVEFFERVFGQIRDIQGILQLLLRNDPPFEWSASGAILRAAEVIALSRFTTWDRKTILYRLAEFEPAISKQLGVEKDFERMIEDFLTRFTRSH